MYLQACAVWASGRHILLRCVERLYKVLGCMKVQCDSRLKSPGREDPVAPAACLCCCDAARICGELHRIASEKNTLQRPATATRFSKHRLSLIQYRAHHISKVETLISISRLVLWQVYYASVRPVRRGLDIDDRSIPAISARHHLSHPHHAPCRATCRDPREKDLAIAATRLRAISIPGPRVAMVAPVFPCEYHAFARRTSTTRRGRCKTM